MAINRYKLLVFQPLGRFLKVPKRGLTWFDTGTARCPNVARIEAMRKEQEESVAEAEQF